MKKGVTIREVAKAAGVSLGTASRALNRAGRVSEAAIVAVGEAARRLGYEPDSVAQSMRTRSTAPRALTMTSTEFGRLSKPAIRNSGISFERSFGGSISASAEE